MTIAEVITEMSTVARFQRESDGALCEEAGCICYFLVRLADIEDELGEYDPNLHAIAKGEIKIDYRSEPPIITKHAHCCPTDLAEKIRSQP